MEGIPLQTSTHHLVGEAELLEEKRNPPFKICFSSLSVQRSANSPERMLGYIIDIRSSLTSDFLLCLALAFLPSP